MWEYVVLSHSLQSQIEIAEGNEKLAIEALAWDSSAVHTICASGFELRARWP